MRSRPPRPPSPPDGPARSPARRRRTRWSKHRRRRRIPSTGHDPDAGSGAFDYVVTEQWYFEHNLAPPPAVVSGLPKVPGGGLIARLLGHGDDLEGTILQRGLELEALAKDARAHAPAGQVGRTRNVAVGRLTKADGEEIDLRAVSGEHDRPGYLGSPRERVFRAEPRRAHDTEVRIFEAAARELKRTDADGVVEIFTELRPCTSCSRISQEFHEMFPNVQVRVYFRQEVVAG